MSKSGRKFWMWTGGIIVVLVAASVIGWLLIKKDLSKPDSAIEKKVSEEFTKMIVKASDSLYHVSYTKFDFDLNSGKGVITDFKLTPDSAVLRRLIQSGRAPNNVMNLSVKSMVINGMHFTKTEQGRKLGIQTILLQKPSIRITNKLQANRIHSDEEKHSEFFSLMQTLLKLSEIKTFTIRQMDFVYVNGNGPAPKKTALRNLNIDMAGITAIETSLNGSKSTAIRVMKNRVATPDSLYYLVMEDFKFMPQQGEATVKLAEVQPRLSKTAFFKHVKWAKDRIHLVYNDLRMKRINLDQLLQKQQIHIGLMEPSSSFAEVYTDYNWPRRVPPVRPHPFPHQQFKDLAFDITIDTMKLKNAETHWRVLADHSDQVSTLDFVKSNGTVLNITNNKEQIARNAYTTVYMQCLLNDAAPMSLKMSLNLKDSEGTFTASSIMGKMDARFLNRFSEPFSMMRVKEGTINKMEMTIQANDHGGAGNVNLYYTGMKVALLKKDKETKELKQRSVVSAISNAMLPNDNPSKNGKFKKGPINAKREAHQSFFGFLSKCMVDGMTSAMTGLAQNKDKKDSNIITKIGQTIIGNPAKKKENKK